MPYKLIKELPGAPCGTEVYCQETETMYGIQVVVSKKSFGAIAYVPKADIHLWVSEDKPKGIDLIRNPEHHTAYGCALKINEIIAQVNKLTGV